MIRKKLAEAYVEILGRYQKFKGALLKVQALLKRSLATMTRWAKRGAIVIGIALAAGIALATRAAKKQEDAEKALEAALRTTGDASAKNIKILKEYAAAIQKVTIYGDEDILSMMAQIKNLGVQASALKESTRMAIGLAAATGMDIKSISRYIALAQQGEFTMLRRYIPALRTTTDKTKQLAIITDFAAKGFEVAQERARTTTGRMKQFWNVIGDVGEAITAPLLPALGNIAIALKEWIKLNEQLIVQKLGGVFRDWGKRADITADKITNAFEQITLSTRILQNAWNAAKLLGLGLAQIIVLLTEVVAGLTSWALKLAAAWGRWLPGYKKIEEFADAFEDVAKTLEGYTETIGKKMEEMGKSGWKSEEDIRKSFAKIREHMKKTREEAEKEAKKPEEEIEVTPSAVVPAKILTKEEKEEERLKHITALEKQRDLYKEMVGFEEEVAELEKEIAEERARTIAKGLDISEEEARRGVAAKEAAEKEAEAKEKAEEEATRVAEKAARSADEIRAAAAERAKVGLVGFEQAWGQIATGANQIEQNQLKEAQKQTPYLKSIAEDTRIIKDKKDSGGYAP